MRAAGDSVSPPSLQTKSGSAVRSLCRQRRASTPPTHGGLGLPCHRGSSPRIFSIMAWLAKTPGCRSGTPSVPHSWPSCKASWACSSLQPNHTAVTAPPRAASALRTSETTVLRRHPMRLPGRLPMGVPRVQPEIQSRQSCAVVGEALAASLGLGPASSHGHPRRKEGNHVTRARARLGGERSCPTHLMSHTGGRRSSGPCAKAQCGPFFEQWPRASVSWMHVPVL